MKVRVHGDDFQKVGHLASTSRLEAEPLGECSIGSKRMDGYAKGRKDGVPKLWTLVNQEGAWLQGIRVVTVESADT